MPIAIEQVFEQASQHHRAGRLREAESLYREILAQQPEHAGALHGLGMLAQHAGQIAAAIDLLRRAVAIEPSWAEAYFNLGNVLFHSGNAAEAVKALRRAAELAPNSAAAYNSLGAASALAGDFDSAITAYRRALELCPDLSAIYLNLGHALGATGRAEEAMEAFRRGAAGGDAHAAENVLLTMHYVPGIHPAQILEEHRRWGENFVRSIGAVVQAHANDRSPDRRLRIGYVSADFNAHPAGRFLLPLLENHDQTNVEAFCYSNVSKPDFMTERFRSLKHVWRDISSLSDNQATQLIQQDKIDILLDLSLHSDGNRLGIFARKPAPIQATWLGYASTTGISTIDYRLSDPYLDPAGTDGNYVEKTWRLPRCFWCYQPPQIPAEITPLPAQSRGTVTFASFNNFMKVSPPALRLWSRILPSIPGSRMIVHAPVGSHRQRVTEIFSAAGVEPSRLEFFEFLPTDQFLRLHQQVDIALDPFPFNGGTTTCDALWMGVPVVSLRGATAVGRAGASILSNVGIAELIAEYEDQYFSIATGLARDLTKLAARRSALRHKMLASPLADARRFASDMETAYRQMWVSWCEAQCLRLT